MTNPENRNFNKYFGLTDAQNHFMTSTVDICDTRFLYKPTLPQSILKPNGSPSSFVILSPYGTGKSMLRCAYSMNLNSQCFIVSLFNAHLSGYIERFVKTNTKNNDSQNGLEKWGKKDFAQTLLSVLVTQFLKQLDTNKINIMGMTTDEKMDLIFIACYYYNGDSTEQLEKLVNFLLGKKDGMFGSKLYKATTTNTQIRENNRHEDKPLLTQFQNDIQNFKVFDLTQNRKLHLLLAIVEGEKYQANAKKRQMHDNVLEDLIKFSTFMKKYVNKKVVFIIDGIDENNLSRASFNDYG
ncbi:unnamed protein product [Adineta steineri]|uniref:Uncharacterized protein n=1 Tax=Adineta steineri TaxID=433720 RepID=A0A813MTX1_9BILA|nr:unnamed protein product [Adineta steineri]CAF3966488.1 unnamed protein product [Adineta steineri]